MKTDDIEKYLCHELNADEQSAFEHEMSKDPELQEDVRIVSYTIQSVVLVGHERDLQRIREIKNNLGGDLKRCIASVAVFVVAVVALAAVSVPVYRHIVLPMIEKITNEDNGRKEKVSKANARVANQQADTVSKVAPAVDKWDDKTTENKAATNDAMNETDQQNGPAQGVVQFEPVCKYMGNTMFELAGIRGNRSGELVIDLNLSNDEESVFVELGRSPIINVDGDEYRASGIQFGKSSGSSASVKKGIPVHLRLTYYVNGKPKKLKLLRIVDDNSAHEVRFQNDLPISWE